LPPRAYIACTIGQLGKLFQAPIAERCVRSRLQRKEKRMPRSHSSKAEDYRRGAKACGHLAVCARSTADREQLLRMRDARLALAATEDWLGGLPPMPPGNSDVLAVPGHA